MKDRIDFNASMSLLEDHLWFYRKGLAYHYRGVAIQLFNLLCDSSRTKVLVRRIFPDIKFHPVLGSSKKEGETVSTLEKMREILGDDHMLLPALVTRNQYNAPRVVGLFDSKQTPIEFEAWLDQALFNPEISIRKLITSIRNGEAAHPDPEYNETQEKTKGFKVGGTNSDQLAAIAVGEYIHFQLARQMKSL